MDNLVDYQLDNFLEEFHKIIVLKFHLCMMIIKVYAFQSMIISKDKLDNMKKINN